MTRHLRKALTECLLEATRRSLVQWTHDGFDEYSTSIVDHSYRIHWEHWYGLDGISIDKQAVVIEAGSIKVPFVWGDCDIDSAMSLIATIDSQSRTQRDAFYKQIWENARAVGIEPLTKRRRTLVNASLMQFVAMLRDATLAGKIKWKRSKPHGDELYVGSHANRSYTIQILYPSVNEDADTACFVARLAFSGFTVDFSCGTEGMFMIEEMLSSQIREWRLRCKAAEKALIKEIRYISLNLQGDK